MSNAKWQSFTQMLKIHILNLDGKKKIAFGMAIAAIKLAIFLDKSA